MGPINDSTNGTATQAPHAIYTTAVYLYDQLDEEAQARALDAMRAAGWGGLDSDWDYEWLWDAPRKWLEANGVRVHDWSIGPHHRGFHIKMDCKYLAMNLITGEWVDKAAMLADYEATTGMVAGSWLDELAQYINAAPARLKKALSDADPENFMRFYATTHPRVARLVYPYVDIIDDVRRAIEHGIETDVNATDEYQNSDEYLEEMARANEYEFTKDGELYL